MTPEQRERKRAQDRARYAANPEKAQAKLRKWAAVNIEKVRDRARARRAANPDSAREYHLKHRYGIPYADYVALLERAAYRCEVCGAPLRAHAGDADHPGEIANVDHDHAVECAPRERYARGAVRGVLCEYCNRKMLPALESPHAARAIEYLQRHEALKGATR